jgi:hypothetical protein
MINALIAIFTSAVVIVPVALADKESDSVTVTGWLTEINPAAHTFAIRNGKKILQFTISPSHTNIQVDDWGSFQRSLSSAHIAAAVMVELSITHGRPTVDSVKFTHHPATAIPVKTRPGFVFSPYSHALFDVRKCTHGDMLEDVWPGQIFLVP